MHPVHGDGFKYFYRFWYESPLSIAEILTLNMNHVGALNDAKMCKNWILIKDRALLRHVDICSLGDLIVLRPQCGCPSVMGAFDDWGPMRMKWKDLFDVNTRKILGKFIFKPLFHQLDRYNNIVDPRHYEEMFDILLNNWYKNVEDMLFILCSNHSNNVSMFALSDIDEHIVKCVVTVMHNQLYHYASIVKFRFRFMDFKSMSRLDFSRPFESLQAIESQFFYICTRIGTLLQRLFIGVHCQFQSPDPNSLRQKKFPHISDYQNIVHDNSPTHYIPNTLVPLNEPPPIIGHISASKPSTFIFTPEKFKCQFVDYCRYLYDIEILKVVQQSDHFFGKSVTRYISQRSLGLRRRKY